MLPTERRGWQRPPFTSRFVVSTRLRLQWCDGSGPIRCCGCLCFFWRVGHVSSLRERVRGTGPPVETYQCGSSVRRFVIRDHLLTDPENTSNFPAAGADSGRWRGPSARVPLPPLTLVLIGVGLQFLRRAVEFFFLWRQLVHNSSLLRSVQLRSGPACGINNYMDGEISANARRCGASAL